MSKTTVIQSIQGRILTIRGMKVMLDRDLAELYGVTTKVLNQGVKRNKVRFPDDFAFQLSHREFENWKSQFVTSNFKLKMGLRKRSYAFTEHGILMLSSVLNNKRAVQVNIQIMRMFIKMRELISSQKDILFRLDELEKRYDKQFHIVFKSIRLLLTDNLDKRDQGKRF